MICLMKVKRQFGLNRKSIGKEISLLIGQVKSSIEKLLTVKDMLAKSKLKLNRRQVKFLCSGNCHLLQSIYYLYNPFNCIQITINFSKPYGLRFHSPNIFQISPQSIIIQPISNNKNIRNFKSNNICVNPILTGNIFLHQSNRSN